MFDLLHTTTTLLLRRTAKEMLLAKPNVDVVGPLLYNQEAAKATKNIIFGSIDGRARHRKPPVCLPARLPWRSSLSPPCLVLACVFCFLFSTRPVQQHN